MTKKEKVQNPDLDMQVFHEDLADGKELATIVGIRKTEVELENSNQTLWLPIEGIFRLRKVCEQVEKYGTCTLHNIHCSHPSCEPYVISEE